MAAVVLPVVVGEVARLLGVPPETVDCEGTLVDQGIGSVLGMDLVDALNAALELDLGPEVVYDHPTPVRLAEEIDRRRVPTPAPAVCGPGLDGDLDDPVRRHVAALAGLPVDVVVPDVPLVDQGINSVRSVDLVDA
ncbi:polyketide synthase, partial [Micromonospora sp. ATCC 39149]